MSAFDNVIKAAKEWQPQLLPTELKYRNSLTTFLRGRLRDAKIETEYRHSGTTIDIYVKQSGFLGASEVFIELKRNLLHKTQLDRLVGQIESLQPGKNAIVVILCGETNPALVSRFNEKYKLGEDYFLLTSVQMTVIVKENADYRIDPSGGAVVLQTARATQRGGSPKNPLGTRLVFRTKRETADFVKRSEAEGFTFQGKEFLGSTW
jgi:hypothetical protein